MSTIHTIHQATDFVERLRRRFTGKSSYNVIVRKAYGDKPQAIMTISRIIDDYNFNMNGVDIADQQRSNYVTQRKALRNWVPLFYWILGHACINAFKVGCLMSFFTKSDHTKFREFLYQDLLAYSTNHKNQRNCMRMQTKLIKGGIHTQIKSGVKRVCEWCAFQSKMRLQSSKVKRPNRSFHRCDICGVFLCVKGSCFEAFHNQE